MSFRKKPLPERVRVRVRTEGGFSRGRGGGAFLEPLEKPLKHFKIKFVTDITRKLRSRVNN